MATRRLIRRAADLLRCALLRCYQRLGSFGCGTPSPALGATGAGAPNSIRKATVSGRWIGRPKAQALGPVAKLLIYGLFRKGRVLAQDGSGLAGRNKLVYLIGLGEVVAGLGRGVADRFHRAGQIGQGFTDGNQPALFTLHGLFSHVPQTRPPPFAPSAAEDEVHLAGRH